jgi:hypothetical protein
MRDMLLLAVHLLVTVAKLLRPGGVRAVAAESLLLKHQLQISNRARQRAPNLTSVVRKNFAFARYPHVMSLNHVLIGAQPIEYS